LKTFQSFSWSLSVVHCIIDANLYHYRDSSGLEVDAILELSDGRWLAIEIKLGMGAVEDAVKNLAAFSKRIDTKLMGEPSALLVITGTGFAHLRQDGIYVVPLSVLGEPL
jgi:hypothetical protein